MLADDETQLREDSIVKYSEKNKLDGKKYLFLPLNISDHWLLIVVHLKSTYFNILSSLGKPTDFVKKGDVSAKLKNFFQIYNKTNKLKLKINFKYHEPSTVYPKQTNLIDCGVYILKYLSSIANEIQMEENFSADEYRVVLATNITENRD